ncbi:MAG: hypothetical protein KA785_06935 [Spirochaetaceae bacterium]|nr:hypothetical protein [Spirochaetaceae bacterium]
MNKVHNPGSKAEDLINRYVYAAGRLLPMKNRKEIEAEIRSLISDMLDERLAEKGKSLIEKDESDVKVVLTELGLPLVLASKYRNEKESYLIGPRYFSQYIFLLKIVLASVAFGLTLAAVLGTIFSEDLAQEIGSIPSFVPLWLAFLGKLLFSLINGGFWAFGMVTLVFAIFQWKSINFSMGDESLDSLPEVPKKKETYSRGETIFSMVMALIFFVVFLTVPGIFRVFDDKGLNFPVFLSDVIQSRWPLLAAVVLCGLLRDAVRLIAYKRTLKTFLLGFICNAAAIPFTILFFIDGKIFNPEFYSFMSSLFSEGLPALSVFFGSFSQFFMGIVLFALLLDSIDDFVRAGK